MESVTKKISVLNQFIKNDEIEIQRIQLVLTTTNLEYVRFLFYCSKLHQLRSNVKKKSEEIAKLKYYKQKSKK